VGVDHGVRPMKVDPRGLAHAGLGPPEAKVDKMAPKPETCGPLGQPTFRQRLGQTRWVHPMGCPPGGRRWVGPRATLGPTHEGPPTWVVGRPGGSPGGLFVTGDWNCRGSTENSGSTYPGHPHCEKFQEFEVPEARGNPR